MCDLGLSVNFDQFTGMIKLKDFKCTYTKIVNSVKAA